MKRLGLQILASLFALNLIAGVAACGGGGCGKEEEEEAPKKMTQPKPFDPNANRPGVAGEKK